MTTKQASPLLTLTLGAVAAIPPLCIDMGLPAIPLIETEFQAAVQRGALTLAVFLAGFALSPLPSGALADRYGRRPVLLVGLSLMALAAFVGSFSHSFASLLVFRFFQGIGAGMCVVLPIVIIRDLFEGTQARLKLAQITAVLGIAPMLAPILGGWVLHVAGWRAILALQAAAGAVLVAVVWWGLPESLRSSHKHSVSARTLLASGRALVTDGGYRNFTLLFAFGFACVFTYIASASSIFMNVMGMPAQTFSLVFAITAMGIVAGSVAGGLLTKQGVAAVWLIKLGVGGMMGASSLLLAATLSSVTSAYVLVPLLTLLLASFGLLAPSTTHEAMSQVPHLAGSAAGLSRAVQMGLAALASALAVALAHQVGPVVSMAVLALAFSSVAALVLVVHLRATAAVNAR